VKDVGCLPIDAGQGQIENDQAWVMSRHKIQGLPRIPGTLEAEAYAAHDRLVKPENARITIDGSK
jgi:hypothetical protein